MARTISDFPQTGRNRKYPWDKWLNGKIWELEEGEDYHIPSYAFARAAWNHAKRYNRRISFRVMKSEGVVILQALKTSRGIKR